MTQPTLFGEPPAVREQGLTERQQFVLELVSHAGRQGLAADDVGAAWHAQKGKHPVDDRCSFCGISGREVLRALRRKGHVKSRRSGEWYALDGVAEPDPPGMNKDIPY